MQTRPDNLLLHRTFSLNQLQTDLIVHEIHVRHIDAVALVLALLLLENEPADANAKMGE